MSDKESASELTEMVGVHVVNTAHEGYRRAGFVLHQGENTLPPVTAAVLEALEADPRLTVMVIASNPDSDPPRGLGDPIAPAAIVTDEPTLSVGEVTVVVDGEAVTDEPASEVTATEEVKAPQEPAPEATSKGKGKK